MKNNTSYKRIYEYSLYIERSLTSCIYSMSNIAWNSRAKTHISITTFTAQCHRISTIAANNPSPKSISSPRSDIYRPRAWNIQQIPQPHLGLYVVLEISMHLQKPSRAESFFLHCFFGQRPEYEGERLHKGTDTEFVTHSYGNTLLYVGLAWGGAKLCGSVNEGFWRWRWHEVTLGRTTTFGHSCDLSSVMFYTSVRNILSYLNR